MNTADWNTLVSEVLAALEPDETKRARLRRRASKTLALARRFAEGESRQDTKRRLTAMVLTEWLQ